MQAPEATFWIGSDHPFDLGEVYLNLRADAVAFAEEQLIATGEVRLR